VVVYQKPDLHTHSMQVAKLLNREVPGFPTSFNGERVDDTGLARVTVSLWLKRIRDYCGDADHEEPVE